MSQFPWVLMIAATITRQQETMSGVMGGTPLRNWRDRRLHSVTKSLNLSPQRSLNSRWIAQIVGRYKSKSTRSKSLTLRGTTS